MFRDFVGYQGDTPKEPWPHQARIAVNFILNYEEGSESNILDGDSQSEGYLTDIPHIVPRIGKRHLSSESVFEYGSRAGAWRLLKLFDEFKIPVTIFATGQALERNPQLAKYFKESSFEIAGHGYRWINYQNISKEVEKEHFQKTIQVIKTLTNKKVFGWYTGRKSDFTLEIVRELKLLYSSDSYSDDLPYYHNGLLIIPYSLDTNDSRFVSGHDFFLYLKSTFDCLYREGKTHPKMMSVGLHGRLGGRPGRTEAVRQFIEYIQTFDKVWICRRQDIAEHWLKRNSV